MLTRAQRPVEEKETGGPARRDGAAPPLSVQAGCSRLPSCVLGRAALRGPAPPQPRAPPRDRAVCNAQQEKGWPGGPGHAVAARSHPPANRAPELGLARPPWLSSSSCPRRAGCAAGAPPYVPVLGGAPGGRHPEGPPCGELGPKTKDRALHGAAGRGLPAGGRPGPEANGAGISHRATPQPRVLGMRDSAARGVAPRRPWSPRQRGGPARATDFPILSFLSKTVVSHHYLRYTVWHPPPSHLHRV